MYKLRLSSLYVVISTLALTLSSCEDSLFERDQPIVTGKPATGEGDKDLPEAWTNDRDGRYPYPEIIEREYIPRNDLFAHTKCLAWRITWPDYDASMDPEKIPTAFSKDTGFVNSIYFLNNTSAGNTYKCNFSLYYGNKVESANSMWDELIYTLGSGSNMVTTYFAESDNTLDIIKDWVMERPKLFGDHWPGGYLDEIEYEEGDFIQYKLELGDIDLYGGIRIVSMTPRIIEVYLAVPNY
jgi:hypothetical protein